jgi:hypothetical protein
VNSSHSCVTPYSCLVIFVFSKAFSFRVLSCSIQSSTLSTHTSLSNQSPHHTLCIQPIEWNPKQCPKTLCHYPQILAPATRITDVEPRALATEQGICLTMESSLRNYDPYPTHFGCVPLRTVHKPLYKGLNSVNAQPYPTHCV